jgi:predicted Zn-dependent protease
VYLILILCPPISLAQAATPDKDNDNNEYLSEDFEEENSIQICCTWGSDMQDGKLTYNIDDTDSSKEEQDAVRNAIEQWDSKIDSLDLERVSTATPSDITVEFRDGSEETNTGEEIAGQTVTTFDQFDFLDNARITILKEPYGYELDTLAIEQVTKHEMGHALGLGHANFDGNLMAQKVNDGTDNISDCEIKAVIEANYWKLGSNNHDNTYPSYPEEASVICDDDQ